MTAAKAQILADLGTVGAFLAAVAIAGFLITKVVLILLIAREKAQINRDDYADYMRDQNAKDDLEYDRAKGYTDNGRRGG